MSPVKRLVSGGVKKGFTLIELMAAVAIIGILASIILFSVSSARDKARDAKRKAELSQIGRLLSASCYIPDAGAGTYDLADIIEELKIKYPQHANLLRRTPMDPRLGSEVETYYRYEATAGGDCAVYANLEHENEPVTLPDLTEPTPGGGIGVLEAGSDGWNGTPLYFQVSN